RFDCFLFVSGHDRSESSARCRSRSTLQYPSAAFPSGSAGSAALSNRPQLAELMSLLPGDRLNAKAVGGDKWCDRVRLRQTELQDNFYDLASMARNWQRPVADRVPVVCITARQARETRT